MFFIVLAGLQSLSVPRKYKIEPHVFGSTSTGHTGDFYATCRLSLNSVAYWLDLWLTHLTFCTGNLRCDFVKPLKNILLNFFLVWTALCFQPHLIPCRLSFHTSMSFIISSQRFLAFPKIWQSGWYWWVSSTLYYGHFSYEHT